MGLDMFAYKRKDEAIDDVEIAYWRKHHDLHGLMQEIYESKGGFGDFNGDEVELTLDDLIYIQMRVTENSLPHTVGFFFGDNPPDKESKKNDLKFIRAAKKALTEGYKVLYNSSW